MALMLSSLYDALIEAGASEEKARKAAEEAAQYEARFGALEQRMTGLEGRINTLTWMVGTQIGLTLLGFSILMNWVWQIMQRLPVKP
jgi:hypothetical protein